MHFVATMHPDPLGSLQHFPNPLAGLRGRDPRDKEEREGDGKGNEGVER